MTNSNLDNMFKKLNAYFSSTSGKNEVQVAGTIATITLENENVIIGTDTLRCVFNANDKSAIIGITPVSTKVGSYLSDIDLTISVINDGFTNKYNRLYVDGGELFQYSTVHDFDFTIYKDFLAKYLVLLKVLKVSPRIKKDHPTIDEAIKNVEEAVELYNKEA